MPHSTAWRSAMTETSKPLDATQAQRTYGTETGATRVDKVKGRGGGLFALGVRRASSTASKAGSSTRCSR